MKRGFLLSPKTAEVWTNAAVSGDTGLQSQLLRTLRQENGKFKAWAGLQTEIPSAFQVGEILPQNKKGFS